MIGTGMLNRPKINCWITQKNTRASAANLEAA